jgi:hypothetical protein
MGYTHFDKVSGINGLAVGKRGSEVSVASSSGQLFQSGAAIAADAAQINNVMESNTLTRITAINKPVPTSGITLITGGAGLTGLTLAAPSLGCRCEIRLDSLSSGSVVCKTAEGVTFDGTNNTATFDAAGEALILVYEAATKWAVVENIGSVGLSTT